jgi:hypothetical protein
MPIIKTKRLTLSVSISDMEISTVLDEAFCGADSFTPILHSHPWYELFCALGGSFNIDLPNGNSIHMPPHSICILPPDVYHKTRSDNSDAHKLAFQFFYHPIEKRSEYRKQSDIIVKNGT